MRKNKLQKREIFLAGLCLVLCTSLFVGITRTWAADWTEKGLEKGIERGNDLLLKNRYADAASAYQKVLQANPNDIYAQLGLGMAYKGQGQLNQAQAIFERIIAQAPDFSPAYYDLGLVYDQQQQPEKAAQAFRQYVQRAGDDLPSDPAVINILRRYGAL